MNDNPIIQKKKFAILLCGVLLYFLTCMAKVLIPGIIYDDLLACGLDSRQIAGTGAAFMYAYAASQLLAGIFSNRFGGVRILLTGGSLFALGTVAFPWVEYYPLMLFCRVMAGLGAGTVFLGVVKLVSDLYSEKFAMVLGTIMFCSYFGPSCGTTPMVKLTELLSWRISMSIPGITAAIGIAVIIALMPGTIKPVTRGENLQPLFDMLKNKAMWLLCLSSSVIFGVYYIITSQLGQKSIIDHCNLSASKASTVILALTILVAVNNIGGNFLLKLCKNRRKIAAFCSFFSTLMGTILGLLAFKYTNSVAVVTAAYILIAIPAGFFPIFGMIAKEINPPEQTGLAVALLNFWCFVFIAVFQNISGRILQHFAITGQSGYPAAAYCGVFIFLIIANAAGTIASCFYRETRASAQK